MNWIDQPSLVIPRYGYGVVEDALVAALFGASSKSPRGALRARLKHLQRLGLPGLKAGKGTRVLYNDMQAHQWLIAILLIEAFVDPSIAAQVIHQYWKSHLARWIGQAVADPESLMGNPLILCLRPKLMKEIWQAKSPVPAIEAFRRDDPAQRREIEITGGITKLKPLEGQARLNADNVLHAFNKHRGEWICFRDLTELLLQFKAELKKGESDGRP